MRKNLSRPIMSSGHHQPRQQAMMQRMEFEALYGGGSAGGGKSDYLLVEALETGPYRIAYRAVIYTKNVSRSWRT